MQVVAMVAAEALAEALAEATAEVVVVDQEVAAVLAVAAALEADQAVVADTLPTPIVPLQSLNKSGNYR
jgi:hypothetical protein